MVNVDQFSRLFISVSGSMAQRVIPVFHISCLIKRQKEFWQKWGLSLGYTDHFPTALTITSQSQLC